MLLGVPLLVEVQQQAEENDLHELRRTARGEVSREPRGREQGTLVGWAGVYARTTPAAGPPCGRIETFPRPLLDILQSRESESSSPHPCGRVHLLRGALGVLCQPHIHLCPGRSRFTRLGWCPPSLLHHVRPLKLGASHKRETACLLRRALQ